MIDALHDGKRVRVQLNGEDRPIPIREVDNLGGDLIRLSNGRGVEWLVPYSAIIWVKFLDGSEPRTERAE
jgi:hypothetical protein